MPDLRNHTIGSVLNVSIFCVALAKWESKAQFYVWIQTIHMRTVYCSRCLSTLMFRWMIFSFARHSLFFSQKPHIPMWGNKSNGKPSFPRWPWTCVQSELKLLAYCLFYYWNWFTVFCYRLNCVNFFQNSMKSFYADSINWTNEWKNEMSGLNNKLIEMLSKKTNEFAWAEVQKISIDKLLCYRNGWNFITKGKVYSHFANDKNESHHFYRWVKDKFRTQTHTHTKKNRIEMIFSQCQ